MPTINANGPFQWYSYFAITWGMNSIGFFFYTLAYMELMPTAWVCFDQASQQYVTCVPSQFCDQPGVDYKPDYEAYPEDIQNWVPKLDLACKSEFEVGLIGSSLFAGWCATLLWLPGLSDIFGRRRIFQGGMAAQTLVFTAIMLSRSYWLTVGCIFAMGMLSSIRVNVGYMYLAELVGAEYRTLYGTIWNISEGLIYIYATVYFWKINTNWFYFVSVGYGLQVASLLMILCLPESPIFLLTKGRVDEAEQAYKQIAKWNSRQFKTDLSQFKSNTPIKSKLDDPNESIGDVITESSEQIAESSNALNKSIISEASIQTTESAQEPEKQTSMYFMRQREVQINLTVMSFAWLTASFNYYMVSFLLKYFPGDIYVNGIFSATSETFAFILSGVFYRKMGVKLATFIAFAIAASGGASIVAYEYYSDFYQPTRKDLPGWIFPCLVLTAKFGIACAFNLNYCSNIDVFPLAFSATSLGIVNFLARFASIFAPPVAEIQSLLPMTLFTFLTFLSMLSICLLRVQKRDQSN